MGKRSTKVRHANFKDFESRSANSRYFRITSDMMNSAAWKELDPYDITTYAYLKSKYYVKKDGTDNVRDISLTYEEMTSLMSQNRFKKSIDKLISVGLIDLEIHNPHTRKATIYSLSKRWHSYKTQGFKPASRPVAARKSKTLCHQET